MDHNLWSNEIFSGRICTPFVIRDLKLGNVFLNDSMEVKIGDFGLATKVFTFLLEY